MDMEELINMFDSYQKICQDQRCVFGEVKEVARWGGIVERLREGRVVR